MSKLSLHIPRLLPFSLLKRISGVNPLIINYHMVSDESLSHVKHLYNYRNSSKFREDLSFLNSKYTPIGIKQFLDLKKTGKPLPRNSVLITFDDGFREVYEIAAPILLEKKIPATFFLTRDFVNNANLGADQKKSLIIEKLRVENNDFNKQKVLDLLLQNKLAPSHDYVECILKLPYKKRELLDEMAGFLNIDFNLFLKTTKPFLTSEQIKELIDSGFTIGSHSIDHPYFAELTLEEQKNQIQSSVDFVCQEFNLDYKVFAFPYTDISLRAVLFNWMTKQIDASFGTQGTLTDSAPNNYQRVSMEKYKNKADITLKFNYLRQYIYNLMGKQVIRRL